MTDNKNSPPIINYDGQGDYTYKTDFWQDKGREYEDRVERIALDRLLRPAQGHRLLELGAGFGRLSHFFTGYKQVILLDYSRSQLLDARSRLGDEKYIYVAANIYHLPLAPGLCDAATMIRVLHHFVDVPAALRQIHQVLTPGAVFVLEYANKRNLKAMLRYLTRQQTWSPYTEDPVEFYPLHFDFHPDYIQKTLQAVGFETHERLPVSYFRLGVLKQLIPTGVLTALDRGLQQSGLLYAPSIFTRNIVPGSRPGSLPDRLFKCPVCSSLDLENMDDRLVCQNCQRQWSKTEGVYDFREPINAG